ncbi:MAG: hypothetical protein AAF614_37560 [Chloroflexota bacterium]
MQGKLERRYQAYLLRLERGKAQSIWRATLTDVSSGEVRRFASEHDLIRYLLQALHSDLFEGESSE